MIPRIRGSGGMCKMSISYVLMTLAITTIEAFDVSSRTSCTFTQQTPITTTILSPYTTQSTSQEQQLTMKVSGGSKRTRSSKSSQLIELNNERLQTAGRPGTKNFVDPNKVFIGNLPYTATEDDISKMFATHWNIPINSVNERIESIKIIRDWKTNQSKGYGFIQFYEPMVATSAMESINKGKGLKINGRRIRLDQGKRKPNEEEERLKSLKQKEKKKKLKALEMQERELDEEGRVILDGINSAVSEEEEEVVEEGMMSEDDMIAFIEKGGLKGVMPLTEETAGFLGIEGLYDDDEDEDMGYFEEYYAENGYDDDDFNVDIDKAGDDDEDDDDEELVYDGVFEEMYNPNEYEGLSDKEEEEVAKMNREQRRAADKKRKKRKLPFKGFGTRD